MIPESAVQNFKNALRGPLLVPGETAYEATRMVPNPMIDRRPCLIARCAGAVRQGHRRPRAPRTGKAARR